MRLELHLMEIYVHQVDTADIAVPCGPVVELHRLQVGSSSELCCARKTFRNVCLNVLLSDRNVEVVQDMECLHYCVESGCPYRSRSLEECRTYESRR